MATEAITSNEETNVGFVHGWACFHCWEYFPPSFAGQQAALHHFGDHPTEDPACRINARQFRAMQDLVKSYQNEDAALHRELAGMRSDHAIALRREEEKGYARGLADAQKYPETIGLMRAAS